MIKIKNNKKKLNRFRNNKNFKTTIISLSSLGAITIILGSTIPFCIGVQYKSAIQVVVSDPSSQLADNSFSENVYEGVRNFFKKESGINLPSAKDCSEGNGLWKRPGTTGHDWERMNTYENIKNDGSKVIIATGFNQQSALQKVTSTTYSNYFNSLKDTGFIFVDGRLEKEYNDGVNKVNSDPTNISSITYRADNGSFLVGVATGVYLNQNIKLFYPDFPKNRPSTIGASAFVGLAIDGTLPYFNGFRRGLDYWNIISKYVTLEDGKPAIPIEWISPKKGSYDINNFISGSFSPNEDNARNISDNVINNGAKVILPIAGPQTNLVVSRAVSAQGKKINVAVIGVDTPQEEIPDLQKPMLDSDKQIIPFSTIKKLDESVKGVLQAIKHGNPDEEYEGYYGFGWNNLADVSNDGVGISKAGEEYLIDPLFFWDKSLDEGVVDLTKNDSEIKQMNIDEIPRIKNDTNKKEIYDKYKWILGLLEEKEALKFKLSSNDSSLINWEIDGDEISEPGYSGSGYIPELTSDGSKVKYSLIDEPKQATESPKLNGKDWDFKVTSNR